MQPWASCPQFFGATGNGGKKNKRKKKQHPNIYSVCRGCVFSIFWFFTVNMSPRGVIMGATLLCFLMGLLSPAQSACKLLFFY